MTLMTNLWLWVIVASLANYTAAHMVSQEGDDGPFEIFKGLRALVGMETWYGKGLHCFRCTSFWGGFLMTFIMSIFVPLPVSEFLLIWGAVAALAVLIWRYFA